MFYCPQCSNIYNISKTVNANSIQTGGVNLETVIKDILSNTSNYDILKVIPDLDENIIATIQKSPEFKKLSNTNKNIVINYITSKANILLNNNSSQNITKKMYFLCKNCGNSEVIKENTLILSKNNNISSSNSNNNSNLNVKELLEMSILPRTRNYKCLNEKCKTHTDLNIKSAIFMRENNTHKVRYICEVCETSWNIS